MSKQMLYSGIFRIRERVVNEYCDHVLEPETGDMVDGVIKEVIAQRYRIGDMTAYMEPGTTKAHIGFSICAPSDMKIYQKALGKEMALTMADTCYEKAPYVPKKVREDIAYFVLRIKRYFRDPDLPEWAEKLYQEYIG